VLSRRLRRVSDLCGYYYTLEVGSLASEPLLFEVAHRLGHVLVEFPQCLPVGTDPLLHPVGDTTRTPESGTAAETVHHIAADHDSGHKIHGSADHTRSFLRRVRINARVLRRPSTRRMP